MDSFRRAPAPAPSVGVLNNLGAAPAQPAPQLAQTPARQRPQFAPRTANVSQTANLGRGGVSAQLNLLNDASETQGRDGKRRLAKLGGKKKVAFRASAVAVLTILLVGGFMGGKAYLKARQVFKGDGGAGAPSLAKEVDPTVLNGEGDGRVNILLLGKGGPSHEAGDLTDTLLIASIDPIAKEAALLSIPRDLYVKVPEYGSMKINAVYSNGKSAAVSSGEKDLQKIESEGVSLAMQTVEETIGIPIHYFSMVDFDAFIKSIDTVGGIDINAKTAVRDTNFAWQFGVLDIKAGPQHLDGKTALMYSRSRYTSERGDFDRAERQREVMVALKNKILSIGTFGNPMKMAQLIDDFGDHVTTNIKLEEMKRLYEIGSGIDSSKISSIGFADPPNNFVTTSTIGGQSVVIPRTGMYDFKEIQTYVRTSMKDGFLKSESADLTVLNGSGVSGLAKAKSEELKSYGYSITRIGDAPTHAYQQTVIIDVTNGAKKYTKTYLEKRFGVTAITTVPDPSIDATGADFVIILGKDASISN